MTNWIIGIIIVVILIVVLNVVKNYIPQDFSDTTYDRIVFVPGIKTPVWAVDGWKSYLNYHFKNKEIVLIRDNYHYENKDDMIRLKKKLTDILVDGKKTLVITHSYGGIVVVASMQSEQAKAFNVKKIVTLAGPFDPDFSDLYTSQEQIGYERSALNVPMVSICGIFDTTVPCRSTVFPEAKQGPRILVEHIGFLLPQFFGGSKILKEMK